MSLSLMTETCAFGGVLISSALSKDFAYTLVIFFFLTSKQLHTLLGKYVSLSFWYLVWVIYYKEFRYYYFNDITLLQTHHLLQTLGKVILLRVSAARARIGHLCTAPMHISL